MVVMGGLPSFVVNLQPNGAFVPLHGQWDNVYICDEWSIFYISSKYGILFTSVGMDPLHCTFFAIGGIIVTSGSDALLNVAICAFINDVIRKLIAEFFTRQITTKITDW